MEKYGYIPSPKDLRDYKINKVYRDVELPASFELENLPHVKDQGQVGSCVAHAVSSVLEAYDGSNYSTGWIYGYRPKGYYTGEGMVTVDALKTVTRTGKIYNEDFNYNIEQPEASEIVNDNLNTLIPLANQNKAVSYARLRTEHDIKYALYTTKQPVLIAIAVGANGLRLENDVALIPEKYGGGHQLMCYGWNETGYLIQNSWGETWGQDGRFTLPYDYPISESWALVMEGEAPTPDKKDDLVVKPDYFLIRKIIMYIYKLLKKLFKK